MKSPDPLDVEDGLDFLLLALLPHKNADQVDTGTLVSKLPKRVGRELPLLADLPPLPAGQVRAIIRDSRRELCGRER